jgi:hypothetical protein
MVIHAHVYGSQVRLKFSNRYGTEPLIIYNVELAHHTEDRHTKESSSKLIMFKGKKVMSIPAGKELYSDTIKLFC